MEHMLQEQTMVMQQHAALPVKYFVNYLIN